MQKESDVHLELVKDLQRQVKRLIKKYPPDMVADYGILIMTDYYARGLNFPTSQIEKRIAKLMDIAIKSSQEIVDTKG